MKIAICRSSGGSTKTPARRRPVGVPLRLDFEWDWDAKLGLLRQEPPSNLEVALEAIYRAGSENLGAGGGFHDRFVGFVDQGRSTAWRHDLTRLAPSTCWTLAVAAVQSVDGCPTGSGSGTVDPAVVANADPITPLVHPAVFPCEPWPEDFPSASTSSRSITCSSMSRIPSRCSRPPASA
jgi:hypothetical protein